MSRVHSGRVKVALYKLSSNQKSRGWRGRLGRNLPAPVGRHQGSLSEKHSKLKKQKAIDLPNDPMFAAMSFAAELSLGMDHA